MASALSSSFSVQFELIRHVDEGLPIYCPQCGKDCLNESGYKPWCFEHSIGHLEPKLYDWRTGEPFYPCSECGGPKTGRGPHDYLCEGCRAAL